MLIFSYYPIYGVQIAFRNFSPIKGIIGSDWVGFEYFSRFLKSPVAIRIVLNTLYLSLYQLIAGYPVPIILALALNNSRNKLYKKTVQMVTYAPYFISVVVLVGMMNQFLSPKTGVVNLFIKTLGGTPIMFMGKPSYFRSMYVWSGVWQTAGWGTIIYLAALSSIDPNQHEAAIMDGAGRFKRMLFIDIPGIMPTMIVLLILRCGYIMSAGFEKTLLMQTNTNIMKSEIIATYVYKIGLASDLPNYSYSTAIGLFNSGINFVILIIVNLISKKVSETSLW